MVRNPVRTNRGSAPSRRARLFGALTLIAVVSCGPSGSEPDPAHSEWFNLDEIVESYTPTLEPNALRTYAPSDDLFRRDDGESIHVVLWRALRILQSMEPERLIRYVDSIALSELDRIPATDWGDSRRLAKGIALTPELHADLYVNFARGAERIESVSAVVKTTIETSKITRSNTGDVVDTALSILEHARGDCAAATTLYELRITAGHFVRNWRESTTFFGFHVDVSGFCWESGRSLRCRTVIGSHLGGTVPDHRAFDAPEPCPVRDTLYVLQGDSCSG